MIGMALPAPPPTTARVQEGVLGGELMAVDAVRLLRVSSTPPLPSAQVLTPRNCLKVEGVDAGWIPAQMIQLHSGWYRTD
jgi:hypothetical protein